jgi:hypothetical protein
MPQIEDMEDRLAWERASRKYLSRIFSAVLLDHWSAVFSIYSESRSEGEWMQVAVWAGLPNTVKERIRSMDHESRGTGPGPGSGDPDVAV